MFKPKNYSNVNLDAAKNNGAKIKDHEITRRELLRLTAMGAAAVTAGGALAPWAVQAAPSLADEAYRDVVAAKRVVEGKVRIKVPEVAENGASVPISISVDVAQTEDDYVKAIHIISSENPFPKVATYHMSPKNGAAKIMTRMRMAKTQEVIVVAVKADNTVCVGRAKVIVTVGGC